MIDIIQYSSDKKEEWNAFIKNSKNGNFMFDRNYMDYHSDRFVDNSLMFYKDCELISVLPLSKHGKVLKSHGGLTFGGFVSNAKMKQHRMNDCFVELIKYLKQNDFEKLLYKKIPHIYSEHLSEEDIYSLWLNNAKIIKIEPSTTINLKNLIKMPKGRKAQISRAKREGVVIEESIDFDNFIDLENKILQEYHGTTAVHTGAELKLLNSRFPENIRLYIAMQDGELLAGSLIFVYQNLVHTQYMASSVKGREIGALDLLISSLMDKYKVDKQYFDFGISTEENGRILNEGLISQKEGFGGRTVVHQTWEINL